LGIILYPAILLANVMSLSAKGDRVPVASVMFWRKTLPFKTIQVLTTLFPVIDYGCQRLSRAAHESGMLMPALLWMVPPLMITISIFWIFRRK
jgi:hypothetical protein